MSSASIQQQAADQRLADAEDQLDRSRSPGSADDARQHAQHAAFGAARAPVRAAAARDTGSDSTGRPWYAKTVACPSKRKIEPYTFGLLQQHAGVVDQIARREVIGAVDDDVVVAKISSAFSLVSRVSNATATSG